MILLDTNAVIWALVGSARSAPLAGFAGRIRVSPVSLLEIKLLKEVGRVREALGHTLEEIVHDPRWKLDSPSSAGLFAAAFDIEWTRDPFDRLLVAHASYRGWSLATGDRLLIERSPPDLVLAL